MKKLSNEIKGMIKEAMEEFKAAKGDWDKQQEISKDYRGIVKDYKKSLDMLSVAFTTEEMKELKKLVEELRTVACFCETKEDRNERMK